MDTENELTERSYINKTVMEIKVSEICRLCAFGHIAIQLSSLPGDNAPSYYEIASILTAKVEKSNFLPNAICDDCALKLIFIWEFKIKIEKSQEKFNEILGNNISTISEDLSVIINDNNSNRREFVKIEIEKNVEIEDTIDTDDFDDNNSTTLYLDNTISDVNVILSDRPTIVSPPRAETSVQLKQTMSQSIKDDTDHDTEQIAEKKINSSRIGFEKNCNPYDFDNIRDTSIVETALAVSLIETTIKEHNTEHEQNNKEIKELILDKKNDEGTNKTNDKKKNFNFDAFKAKITKVRNKTKTNKKLNEIINRKNSKTVEEHAFNDRSNDVAINNILTKSKLGPKLSREEENEWQKKLNFWIKNQARDTKQIQKQNREVNHICEICGKIYQTKEGLKGHEYIHTGILKYECTYCGRKFGQKKLLNGHMEVKHIKSKFFTCNICNKVFNRKNTLTKHRWAHIDVKRFKCERCDKLFRWKTCLKDHMNTHTKSIEFPCYACDKIYTTRASRRKHCIKFHNGKGMNPDIKSPEVKI